MFRRSRSWALGSERFAGAMLRESRAWALRSERSILSAPGRLKSSFPPASGWSDRKSSFPIWPWVCAGVTAFTTLWCAQSLRSDELYKHVVLELQRKGSVKRDSLRDLQIITMMFGRWTEELRTKLAANNCVEVLIPLVVRLKAELKDAGAKLMQAHQLNVGEARLTHLQGAVATTYSELQIGLQVLAILIDADVGRSRFFAHEGHQEIIESVLSSSDNVDWSALTNTFIANKTQVQAPKNSPSPPARAGYIRRNPQSSLPSDDHDMENIRPWTASEALLVASLAGDERGQRAIFKSSVVLPTIQAVMAEPAQPKAGQDAISREEALNRHNEHVRRLALLKALTHLASSSLPEAAAVESGALAQALLRLRASDAVTSKLATVALQKIAQRSSSFSLFNTLQNGDEAQSASEGAWGGGGGGSRSGGVSGSQYSNGEGKWGDPQEALGEAFGAASVASPRVAASPPKNPAVVSLSFVKVLGNATVAGCGGMLWGYLRHYRQISKKSLVPVGGTHQRAWAAATITALGSVALSLAHTALEVLMINSWISPGHTMSSDFMAVGRSMSGEFAAIGVSLALAPFSFGGWCLSRPFSSTAALVNGKPLTVTLGGTAAIGGSVGEG